MRVFLLTFLVLSVHPGCGGSLADVIRETNAAREGGIYVHDAIESFCAPAYQRAETKEAYAAADAKCRPAREAYEALRLALASEVLLVVQEQNADKPNEARLQAARKSVADSSGKLWAAILGMRP